MEGRMGELSFKHTDNTNYDVQKEDSWKSMRLVVERKLEEECMIDDYEGIWAITIDSKRWQRVYTTV